MRSREAYGISTADIFEGLANGVESGVDADYWQFKALEYINRYTTKYGALLVIVVGTYTTLKALSKMASSVFGLVFGGRGDAQKDMYVRDKTVRDAWFLSGLDQATMCNSLADGMLGMFPGSIKTVVDQFFSAATSSGSSIGGAVLKTAAKTAVSSVVPGGSLLTTLLADKRQDRTVRDGYSINRGSLPLRNGVAKRII